MVDIILINIAKSYIGIHGYKGGDTNCPIYQDWLKNYYFGNKLI